MRTQLIVAAVAFLPSLISGLTLRTSSTRPTVSPVVSPTTSHPPSRVSPPPKLHNETWVTKDEKTIPAQPFTAGDAWWSSTIDLPGWQSKVSTADPSVYATSPLMLHSKGPPVATLVPGQDRPFNLLLTNQDGWADTNARELFKLMDAQDDMNPILVAGARNMTDGGFETQRPVKPGMWPTQDGCMYGSCPPSEDEFGFNHSDPRFWWTGGIPVVTLDFALHRVGQRLFGDFPDLVVVGPRQGDRMGWIDNFRDNSLSLATRAVDLNITAIHFSAKTKDPTPWNKPAPLSSILYAQESYKWIRELLKHKKMYTPAGTWLDINFPYVNETVGLCNDTSKWRYVFAGLARGREKHVQVTLTDKGPDVQICNRATLPVDRDVVGRYDRRGYCYVSVALATQQEGFRSNVHSLTSTLTAHIEQQEQFLKDYGHLFSCLPPLSPWEQRHIIEPSDINNGMTELEAELHRWAYDPIWRDDDDIPPLFDLNDIPDDTRP